MVLHPYSPLIKTDLRCIVADNEGRALVFWRRVAVSILGGDGEAVEGSSVQLGRQPLEEGLLRGP